MHEAHLIRAEDRNRYLAGQWEHVNQEISDETSSNFAAYSPGDHPPEAAGRFIADAHALEELKGYGPNRHFALGLIDPYTDQLAAIYRLSEASDNEIEWVTEQRSGVKVKAIINMLLSDKNLTVAALGVFDSSAQQFTPTATNTLPPILIRHSRYSRNGDLKVLPHPTLPALPQQS